MFSQSADVNSAQGCVTLGYRIQHGQQLNTSDNTILSSSSEPPADNTNLCSSSEPPAQNLDIIRSSAVESVAQPLASISSPTTAADSLVFPTVSQHQMITRSKHGIFKPRVFLSECSLPSGFVTKLEPKTAKSTMQSLKWLNAMKDEFHALQRNNTWTLFLFEGDNLERGLDSYAALEC
ncbi:hypothetical protein LWI29_017897 [Acer saccharum]|uniref:Uncharacterized protein n=1 Tax=Acer saccharum TaxID=4024 RepID=A0AA39TB08_ACESA|nr:hypothetical protein LWI29_017897 [Acer saccharum]